MMRIAERMVESRPHRWHLLEAGEGPPVLLLHGAGGAAMSFRALMPLLAPEFRLIAPDLPGHGGTRIGSTARQSLDAMSADLAALMRGIGVSPRLIVGHSAGAAIALRLQGLLDPPPSGVIGINAALGHFKGVAGWLFPALAKLLALTPFTARLFAGFSSEGSVRALLASTGSSVGPENVALYHRLVTDPAHVDGTLRMMASWRLDALLADLPRIALPVLLVAAEGDRTVPPEVSARAAERMPNARLLLLPGLGHLAHEEAPETVADAIRDFVRGLAA